MLVIVQLTAIACVMLGLAIGFGIAQILGARPLSNEEWQAASSACYVCFSLAAVASLFLPVRKLKLPRTVLLSLLLSISCAAGTLCAGPVLLVMTGLSLYAFLMGAAMDARNWRKARA